LDAGRGWEYIYHVFLVRKWVGFVTCWKAWDCWILLYGSCWETLLVVGLLQNKDMDLTEKLEAGFGPDSLGIIAIAEVRLSLLPLRLYLSEYIGGRTYLLDKK
jgi:hypothetical protein